MKFRCERDDILGAVQFASRAISTRATLPVLAGLRIEALEGGRVRVAATDLELTMETSFSAAVDEPGKTIVPGRLFGEMTRSLGSGQVSVAGTEGEVELGSGRGQFRVKALAPDDYPSLPIEDDSSAGDSVIEATLEADALAGALSQVVRAASADESRQILTGVLWEISKDEVTLAATDSYRLGVRSLPIEGGPDEQRQVVLPARALAELARALGGGGTGVRALVKENLVSFTITGGAEPGLENAVIGSRFIEGEFPKYRQLLPERYPNTLTVDKDALLDVTKRVGLLAQNNLPLKLRLGAELEISAHTPDVGEGQEVLDAAFDGDSLVIAFNPQFLHDGVSAVRGEEVEIQVGDGLKPAIIQGKGDATFTYLLMPVRLS